jgi:hypothetical protein
VQFRHLQGIVTKRNPLIRLNPANPEVGFSILTAVDFGRPVAQSSMPALRPDRRIRAEGNQLPEWVISRRGHRGSDIHQEGSKAIPDGSSR